MTGEELVFGVFSRDRFPKKCAGGLAVAECVDSFDAIKAVACTESIEAIKSVATFETDQVISKQPGHESPERWNSVYPPKVSVGEGESKLYKSCQECGRIAIVSIQVEDDKVKPGSRVKLENIFHEEAQPIASAQSHPDAHSRMIIHHQMMEPDN